MRCCSFVIDSHLAKRATKVEIEIWRECPATSFCKLQALADHSSNINMDLCKDLYLRRDNFDAERFFLKFLKALNVTLRNESSQLILSRVPSQHKTSTTILRRSGLKPPAWSKLGPRNERHYGRAPATASSEHQGLCGPAFYFSLSILPWRQNSNETAAVKGAGDVDLSKTCWFRARMAFTLTNNFPSWLRWSAPAPGRSSKEVGCDFWYPLSC